MSKNYFYKQNPHSGEYCPSKPFYATHCDIRDTEKFPPMITKSGISENGIYHWAGDSWEKENDTSLVKTITETTDKLITLEKAVEEIESSHTEEKPLSPSEFYSFIHKIYCRCVRKKRANQYEILYNNKDTIVYNKYTGAVGVARFDGKGNYNPEYGVALAYCRMKNIPLPKEMELAKSFIGALKAGDEFVYNNTECVLVGKNPTNPMYSVYVTRAERNTYYEVSSLTEVLVMIPTK